MALHASSLVFVFPIPPAKNRLIPSPSWLILRTPCVNPHPSSSLSTPSPDNYVGPVKASMPQEYVYPDPIPEFAEAETQKFRVELLKKLSKEKDTFGEDLHVVVAVCAQIFREFLHKEYGGPGTLLVEPFTDMLVALKEKKLPGAPEAARASLLWAQNNVDQDWEIWNLKPPKFEEGQQ